MTSNPKPLELSPLFGEALVYAERLHAGQNRKETPIPYISHLLAVCAIVLEACGTEAEAIAALLHDGPEDRGGLAELRRTCAKFGPDVARIVEGCSDSLVDTTVTEKEPWRTRKQAYIDRLASETTSTLLVSAADKLHNARATEGDVIRHGPSIFERFKGKREGTLWYYAELIKAYKRAERDPRREPLVRELEEIITRLSPQRPTHAGSEAT
ncbi:MAG: HD domain-containing protein [Vulcanimicrobiaceae bacterium]